MRHLSNRLVLFLLPIALIALFGRTLYTPDEPREAAMVIAMAKQVDKSLPTLAGEAFAEKPPLLYWLGAMSTSIAGESPAALRIPGLLYILMTALAIAALVRPVAGDTAAFLAGFASATTYILYRTEIWLATDAPLVMGVAIALFGVQRVLTAPSDAARRLGHAALFTGLLISFFAKGPAGWLVPGCAFLTVIALERRWRELFSREFLLGVLAMVAVIGAWILWIAGRPDGLKSLTVLFWYNLFGRFVALDVPREFAYATGHQNHPLTYWLSLPVFLLPWTPLVIAALCKAPQALRTAGPLATTWRLAIGAIGLPMVCLALSATGRDVYYGPVALGFVIAIGLWAGAAREHEDKHARRAWLATRAAVGAIAMLIGALAIIANLAPAFRSTQSIALAAVAALGVAVILALVLRRSADERVIATRLAYAVVVCFTLVIGPLYRPLDRWLSLEDFSRHITNYTGDTAIRLVDADETTAAMAMLYFHDSSSAQAAHTAPHALWLVPDQRQWKMKEWLVFLGYSNGTLDSPATPALPAALQNWTAQCELLRPGGRRVIIAAGPGSEGSQAHCR